MGASCTKAGREEAAFLKAAKEGDCRAIQQAVRQDVEWSYKVQTWNGQTVFHLAARYGRLDVLETVVEAVRFNPAGPEKWSKLLRLGRSTDAILRAFANLPDARCQTPLHLACIYGHADVAQRLLELGSTPWAWDELGGRTPLHYAASMGHVDVIRVVVSHNAPAPTGDALRRPNTARTRLVDICNDSGYTPLHYAVWAGNTASVRALTSYEASLSARNVACGSDWVVSCLKCTPLHLAAHKGSEEVVKLLLSAYVQSQPPQAADAPPVTDRRRRDPRRHVNANRQLPYHVAVSRNHTRLAEILHPDVPFSFILTPAEMESRMYGVAKLAVIASRVLQAKLLSDIDAAVTAMAAAPPPRNAAAGGGGGGLAASASRTRSGNMSALAASGSVMAQQVLAAATARLRAAGERSLGGAASIGLGSPGREGVTLAAAAAATASAVTAAEHTRATAVPSRASHDSTASAPAAVAAGASPAVGAGAAAGQAPVAAAAPAVATAVALAAAASGRAAAAVGVGASSASGGSSNASGGESDKAALPVEDLARRPGPALGDAPSAPQGTTAQQQQQQGSQPQPLPLPPAPIIPFLPPQTAAVAAAANAATAAAAAAAKPPTYDEAASAFARFAAEPFEEPAFAGGRALDPTGSASVSLAALAHNRELQQQGPSAAGPAGAGSDHLLSATSVSVAAVARGRLPGAPGPAAAHKNTARTRSRSLRKLLTGSRLRRSNTPPAAGSSSGGGAGPQPSAAAQPAQPSGGGSTATALLADIPTVPGFDVDAGDDLDEILYAMRPNDVEDEGAAAGSPRPPAAAADQEQRRTRGMGNLRFWRRTSSAQAATATAQSTPDGASSPYTAPAQQAALAALPADRPRPTASPTPLSPQQLSQAPSAPTALPPGVVETRTSVDRRASVDRRTSVDRPPAPAPATASPSQEGAAGAASPDAAADPASQPGPSSEDSLPAADVPAVPGLASTSASAGEASGQEGATRLRRNSISLAVLARAGADAAVADGAAADPAAAAAADADADAPAVDGAVLAMLASLVEAPQHVLRRYRLLQLTHGLDLHDLLRDHSEQQHQQQQNHHLSRAQSQKQLRQAEGLLAATAATGASAGDAGVGAGVGGSVGAGVSPARPLRPSSSGTVLGDPSRYNTANAATAVGAGAVGSSPLQPKATPFASPFAAAAEEASAAVPVAPASPFQGEAGARPPTGNGAVPGAGAAAAGSATLAGQLLRTLSSQAASEAGDAVLCGVCFDQPDSLVIRGCGHRLCADCSRELCKLNTFKPALCPFCRGMIGGFKYAPRAAGAGAGTAAVGA